jgi:hypothetical protein
MEEGDSLRVERLARKFPEAALQIRVTNLFVARASVDRVTDDGAMYGRQMHPDLVCPAGHERQPQEREVESRPLPLDRVERPASRIAGGTARRALRLWILRSRPAARSIEPCLSTPAAAQYYSIDALHLPAARAPIRLGHDERAEVSRSSRWMMPGRSGSPPDGRFSRQWWRIAFATVPNGAPAPGERRGPAACSGSELVVLVEDRERDVFGEQRRFRRAAATSTSIFFRRGS